MDESEDSITHTFFNVLNDVTLSKWSLRNLLLNMFNNNYRRFFENMTEVFRNYEDTIKYYNCKWDEAKCVVSPVASHIRHLCRKMIIRIVLDYMQNTKINPDQMGFFDQLMARNDMEKPSSDSIEKSSYARRILTYLDNMNNINSKPVSSNSIIEALLHKPISKNIIQSNVSNNDRRIDDIAEIITVASQTAKINTNGVELLTLNIDRNKNKKQVLSEIMKAQWNSRIYDNKETCVNLRITPAGSVFAMICPCFEYFVCRYKNNSVPLFMLKSETEREKLIFGSKSNDALPEERIGIIDKAMKCIDAVISYETKFLLLSPYKRLKPNEMCFAKPEWLFDYDGGGLGIVHPLRIICDHLFYLQDYKKFLQNVDESYDNKHYIDNDCEGVIDKAIKKYSEKYNKIVSDYHPYLNLGIIPTI